MGRGSSRLQGLDAVDVNQGNVNEMLGYGIDNGHPVLADGENFRVADLIDFSVGKPHLERLEGSAIQSLADRFCVY